MSYGRDPTNAQSPKERKEKREEVREELEKRKRKKFKPRIGPMYFRESKTF